MDTPTSYPEKKLKVIGTSPVRPDGVQRRSRNLPPSQ